MRNIWGILTLTLFISALLLALNSQLNIFAYVIGLSLGYSYHKYIDGERKK